VSWFLVLLTYRYAMRAGIFDVPSERSSHVVPTPRGAGLGIAVVTLAGVLVAGAAGWVPRNFVTTLAGGGGAIAAIGWIDDRRGLSPRWRLATHFAAAGWAVIWLGPLLSGQPGWDGPLARITAVLFSLLALTWSVSAYNFMDGIDALAGTEAVWVGAIGGAFAVATGHRDVAFVAFLISAASIGFLPWNLPPARIFLGDVGSGFLGYAFAVLALWSERSGSLPAAAWLMLLGVFAFDSTATLCRRLLRREKWYVTHKESAYQRAAVYFGRHAPVTAIVLAADAVLAGLCWFGWVRPGGALLASVISLGVLIGLYALVEKYAPVAPSSAATLT
jgi:Fuc2NAc and GlcNAc transferase